MVSIVMIAYNSAKYIATAIQGVVSQRCNFPIRLIISDDASSDRTGEIVAEWMKRYPDIIEYHRNPENLGVQRNYLEAFRYCNGKYLAMCDADDYWICKTKLSRQVDYMEKHPECAICYHRVVNLYEDSSEMSLSNGGGHKMQVFNAVDLSRRNPITNMSALSRASLIDFANLPSWLADVRLLDYAMHMLVSGAKAGNTIHYMSRPMGVYRRYPQAIWSMAEQSQRMKMAIDVRRHLIRHFSANPEIVANLQKACSDMERKMDSPVEAPPKKSLLSRIRGLVSRLIPVPKP